MNCPECEETMVKRWDGTVLTTEPPQYPWHYVCRECGHTHPGGVVSVLRPDDGPQ